MQAGVSEIQTSKVFLWSSLYGLHVG